MTPKMYEDGTYLKNNPDWHSEDSEWKAKQIMRLMVKNNIKPKTVCEVGCGAGEILRQLQIKMNIKCDFFGYEISPDAYKICKNKSNKRLHYKLKDFTKEKNCFFDLILIIDLIEHLEDYYSFLKKIKSKSKFKIFHIPLDLSVQSVLRQTPLLKGRKDVGHIHSFTKEISLQLLKELNYEIIDYFYTQVSIETPAKSTLDYLTRIPRKLLFAVNKDLTARIIGGYSLIVLTK
jgi:SAM-dependent methyltransferase